MTGNGKADIMTAAQDQGVMRVLISSFKDDLAIERVVLSGIEVDSLFSLVSYPPKIADLLRVLAERPAQVLVCAQELTLDSALIQAVSRAGVRGIVCSSVGYDHVDVMAARQAGIIVCNVPDYGTNEVADHAMALLLWCLRRLRGGSPTIAQAGDSDIDTQSIGAIDSQNPWWSMARFTGVVRLQGLTLALLGFGRIGQAMARRAQAFGFNIRWYDPYVQRGLDKVTGTIRAENLQELLSGAHALSIHCLLNHETRHLIDAEALKLLAPQAVVVNTARGPVVDEEAVHEALRAGHLASAALDVLEVEPPQATERTLFGAYLRGELPKLLLTPHAAWYSQQGVQEMRGKAAAEAGRLVRGEKPWNPVNGPIPIG